MSEHTDHLYTNDLIHESSPYLLQHAHNPVDWHPWGDEAFEKAKAENKLVLISVGYSACHWCHVMEHESFEDTTVAEIMNENFINIKVDREERPDVDQVYMNAVQLMTGSGGWPLNCFALPDGRPIYGGTYFQKSDWVNILNSLQQMKEENPEKMEEYARNLTAGIQNSELIKRNDSSDFNYSRDSITLVVEEWKKYWDKDRGGPNRSPKFPLPNNYQFLLEYAHLTDDAEALEYVYTTLNNLAQGGIYDQVGGGFSRYSTDEDWKVPHFEKMLYDNAQLVSLYSQAYTKSKNEAYKTIVDETLAFVRRELTNENGGFYSALDADSEGEEGKFYVWKKEELEQALTPEEFDFTEEYYNVNSKGLWEHGNYILLRTDKSDNSAMDIPDLEATLTSIKAKLLKERKERIRPGLDDKILTSWNAQMISGYVDAFLAFNTEEYLAVAESQMNFLLRNLQKEDGSLYHTHKDGKSSINGYLEDYSLTIQALIKLYTCKFEEKWLSEAKALANYSLDHFYDTESGMFWFTSDIDPPLVAKKQEVTDNVIPASNSVMAENLFLLGSYFYNEHFTNVSHQMLQNILPYIDYGQSYSNWLRLTLYRTYPFYEVAVTGSSFSTLKVDLLNHYIPNKMIMGGENSSSLPLLEGKFLEKGTIFVCQNRTCQLPVDNAAEAVNQMK